MSDLTERLRAKNEYWQHAPLYNEAADRIEELEAEVKEAFFEGYKRSGKGYYDYEIEDAWDRWRTHLELAAEGESE